MPAVSRYSTSSLGAALMTIALFFLMQALIVSHPVPKSAGEFRKSVPFYPTTEAPKPVPPEVTTRPPVMDNPGIPVFPNPPEPKQVSKIITDIGMPASPPVVAASGMTNGDVFLMVGIVPPYPAAALIKDKEGFAVVEFTVAADGSVTNPVLIEESPESLGFGRSALQAILKFKFQPRIVDGQPVATPGIRERFIFELKDQ